MNDVNLINCSFSTTNENDVILGRFYAGPILPLVQRPPGNRAVHHLAMPYLRSRACHWRDGSLAYSRSRSCRTCSHRSAHTCSSALPPPNTRPSLQRIRQASNWTGVKLDWGSNRPGVKPDRGSDWTGVELDWGSNWTGVKLDQGSNWTRVKLDQGSNRTGGQIGPGSAWIVDQTGLGVKLDWGSNWTMVKLQEIGLLVSFKLCTCLVLSYHFSNAS